jgi:carboxylesterase type B
MILLQKAPVKKSWNGKFNATQYGQKCPQPPDSALKAFASMMIPDNEATYQQSRAAALATDPEDCLVLDVYTPTVISSPLNSINLIP